jgi:hypothetical protein
VMPREIEWQPWFAWYPVFVEDSGCIRWLRFVWRRKQFIGPRCAQIADIDLMIWEWRDRVSV